VFGWRYFDSAQARFPALVLLFLAGMTGFALSGDLFDMFVFFELMSAVAYALTGFEIEEPSAVQGALTFGIVNSLGAYLTLTGIGLLYGRTGQLGLAPLAAALAGHPVDALVAASFVLVVTGFLVKAAVVAFHLWLDDAHAVAPTPVCVLFSGIMVVLGVYGTFRVTTVVFAVLPRVDLHRLFLVLGMVTALVGAVMCVLQRHLKRLLAYSTIAHVGLFVLAFGTLDAEGTAGGRSTRRGTPASSRRCSSSPGVPQPVRQRRRARPVRARAAGPAAAVTDAHGRVRARRPAAVRHGPGQGGRRGGGRSRGGALGAGAVRARLGNDRGRGAAGDGADLVRGRDGISAGNRRRAGHERVGGGTRGRGLLQRVPLISFGYVVLNMATSRDHPSPPSWPDSCSGR
jgi:hypothetical protein